MAYSKSQLWERFQKYYLQVPSLGLAVDISRMNFPDGFLVSMEEPMKRAFLDMAALEKGAIANPDEHRMVGHYWLRNPELAPTPEIRSEIQETVKSIKSFAAQIHTGSIAGSKGPFKNLLLIGIGGSALGPQFVSKALGNSRKDKLKVYFFDNTDPDGMDNVLSDIPRLDETLCLVVSKSGGTKETRNGMLEAKGAFDALGLKFGSHAVAITSAGSELDKVAKAASWIATFPMWDWVGGRTSELSAVGLLPAALQGIDIEQLLAGASACDQVTRDSVTSKNPAAVLALMWYYIGNGKGSKNMVVLPYKDRLELFSKYLQQLVMESLGKEFDLNGKKVNQGITVLGNKGSTDQHSYVQQLREGLDNFFVTFIEVLKDRQDKSMEVEPGITSGDYLIGFMLGTREALYENGRESLMLTINEVSPFSVGVLIALFERVVGYYAHLVNVNAYHQPGVEAGKKAAKEVISIQKEILASLNGEPILATDLAKRIGIPTQAETVFSLCQHLAANPDRCVTQGPGVAPSQIAFSRHPRPS
jgi:glucose-6-phosphate isomerase